MTELPRHLLPPHARSRTVTAVLGPTNTGKTHYAIERMLAYQSGIIGLPLRLLAREVFHKLVARVGPGAVALITGEEKIKPVGARYWVCTVEAMPQDIEADFLAVDEVQLAGDFERGHVFTDRLLYHRGRHETLLLGAGTIRPLIAALLPGAHITARPRLSTLTYKGVKKLTRLPERSAIVAFSAAEVYAIAELIRRQRGGAAVVLGALSPRTRNAQVELFQSGAVDFLVATDAIGMGLNLDVDHIAFAATRKFDGFQFRNLNPAELAQVAGRAGRFMRDGTFGTSGRADELDSEVVRSIEAHDFAPLRLLQWRNPALEFSSFEALRRSLAASPREAGLTRAPDGEDVATLDAAWREPDLRERARGETAVRLLWQTCQVPDYRKISPAAHAELCLDMFRFLSEGGRLPAEWFGRQVARSEALDGDIDTLSMRIAHIRTWSFIANQSNWLDDPRYWRETTARLEDRLSDALHDRLAQRFVDKTTSVLMRRLKETMMLEAQVNQAGEVIIAEQIVGRLQGFRFVPEGGAEIQYGKELRAAAAKALEMAIAGRAERVAEAGNESFLLASNGSIRWMGEEIARLIAGESELEPRAKLLADDDLSGSHREWVQGRVDAWLRHHIGSLLKPLIDLRNGEGLEGLARGIAFRLVEDLGVVERSKVSEDLKTLEPSARVALRRLGVRFGAYHLFLPATMKPKPRELAAQLWALRHGGLAAEALQELPHLAQAGRTSIQVNAEVPKAIYRVLGYRVLGSRAVRVDILERLADLIRPLIAFRPGLTAGVPPKGTAAGDGFVVTVEMTSLAGCSGDDFASILKGLGYRSDVKALGDHERVIAEATAKAAEEAEQRARAAAEKQAALAMAQGAARLEETPATDLEDQSGAAPVMPAGPVALEEAGAVAPLEATMASAQPAAAVVDTLAEIPIPSPAGALLIETRDVPPVEAETPELAMPAVPETVQAIEAAALPASESARDETASAATAAAPATVTIWRPSRFERRPQHTPHKPRREGRGQRQGPAASTGAIATASAAPDGAVPEGVVAEGMANERARHRPRAERRDRKPQTSAADTSAMPAQRPVDGGRPPRSDQRPRRDKMDGATKRPGGGDRGGPRGFDKRPPREQAPRIYSSDSGPRNTAVDPDSPFAKLALLKERLEAEKNN